MEKNKAFTLAETLIVVVILGVIATLTVPNLINKQKETTQRTKVKKAMAVYETAVNKMILENNRSFSGLNEAGCDKTVSHFKYIKRDAEDGCIFETSDKIWWDVTDIQRPIIAFNRDDLTLQKANDLNNKNAYVMVGEFDNQGILRVNDLAYEESKMNNESARNPNEDFSTVAQKVENLEKLYGNTKMANTQPCKDSLCKYRKGYYNKACENGNYKWFTYCYQNKACEIYDDNSKTVVQKSRCNAGYSICQYVSEFDQNRNMVSQTEYDTNDGSIRQTNDYTYDENNIRTSWVNKYYNSTGLAYINKYSYSNGQVTNRTTEYYWWAGNGNLYNVKEYKGSGTSNLVKDTTIDVNTGNTTSVIEYTRYSDNKTKTARRISYTNNEPSSYIETYYDTDGSTIQGQKTGCDPTTNVCTGCTGTAIGTEGCPSS